ncbi:MAG: hypothetical protein K6B70_07135 [Clostridia bacterium]|nr:hypothetical protein [Clostridia bacterium]
MRKGEITMQKKMKVIAISSVCSLVLIGTGVGACIGIRAHNKSGTGFDKTNGWIVISEKE